MAYTIESDSDESESDESDDETKDDGGTQRKRERTSSGESSDSSDSVN